MSSESKTSIYDIAKELGISVSTVSRALKNHKAISRNTIKKVKETAERLNYTPNTFAVNLKNGKTTTIGIVVPEISRRFFSYAIDGIEQEAYKAGYDVMIYQSHESIENEKRIIDTLLKGKVDGVIVSLSSCVSDFSHWKKLIDYRIPLVFFDRSVQMENVSSVTVNDYKGACDAVEHLIAEGYRTIYHFAGLQEIQIWKARKQGYLDTLLKHGISPEKDWICEAVQTEEEGIKYIDQLLKSGKPLPDAIFFAGDYAAASAMTELKRRGYVIPEDIAIMGFANDPLCNYLPIPLSSVEQFPLRIGKTAAKMLMGRLNGDPCMHTILPTRLIIRSSTKRIKNKL